MALETENSSQNAYTVVTDNLRRMFDFAGIEGEMVDVAGVGSWRWEKYNPVDNGWNDNGGVIKGTLK